ncbi:SufE family protein [Alteromonas ponticola]|uniref:SufE family protein n=1 Tax=Alteromonas ponticola TaxID=2720613 RepID=A0ABX1QWW9_9ALTE|nr:SufE family protein [Alteromonas ponticola]NMH58742.1 SufE family protein [Alteromonas ponticola]
MTHSGELKPLALTLLDAQGWDNKMRALVMASKHLPMLEQGQRTETNQVKGCDSDVWLDRVSDDTTGCFMAYSPSKVIRGVLAIILEQTNNLSPEAVATFDFDAFGDELSLSRFLSQSRGNGLRQVIDRIKTLASTQT